MRLQYPEISDLELFGLLSGKQREGAFRELFRRYETRVWAYCRVAMGNDDLAKDVAQEVFIRFLRAGEAATPVDNVGGYIIRIARNLCLNEHKKDKGRFIRIDDDFDFAAPPDGYDRREMTATIELALDYLPAEHKEAVVMQAFSQMSYQEIADAQRVPVTTVRNRISRAKKRLRELLDTYYNEVRDTL